MEKFLYVFSKEARDSLIAANYALLKSDDRNCIYVFSNKMDMTFSMAGIPCMRSTTLAF